jgi:glucan 1,3-beta-glucosidase
VFIVYRGFVWALTQYVYRPAGFDGDLLPVVRQYWYDSYDSVRNLGNGQQSDIVVLLHDAFKGLVYWSNFMPDRSIYQGVAFDTHIYQMFSQDVRGYV